jgi:hypothetical protein
MTTDAFLLNCAIIPKKKKKEREKGLLVKHVLFTVHRAIG